MYESNTIISKELDPHEKLHWAGQPRQGVFLRGADLFMVPFSLMWGGFAIFWEYNAVQIALVKNAGLPFALFGIPFVIMGLYLIVGRFYVDSRQRSKTYYGVTNKRIIILSGLFSKHTTTLNIESLKDITLKEKSNGFGSIIFGQENPMMGFMGGSSWPGAKDTTPKFDNIGDAKAVYGIIRKNQSTGA